MLKHQANFDKTVQKIKSSGQVPPLEFNVTDFKRTMDPVSGLVQPEKLTEINKDILAGRYNPTAPLKLFGTDASGKTFINSWKERGPYSVGGRTRAIMVDPNDPSGKRVFAGGVSGGLWVNADITNPTSEWKPIGDQWGNTSIVCITSDPNNSKIFYVGTGESPTYDNVGSGIWKSTDGGTTWTQIMKPQNTYNSQGIRNGYFYVNDIKVRNNNGVSEVYAGLSGGYNRGFHGLYQARLYKSVDGGATFKKNADLFLPEATNIGLSIQQIEIGIDNAVWVSTRTGMFSGVSSGGKIFKSEDGEKFEKVYDANLPGSRVQIALSKQYPAVCYGLLQGDPKVDPVRIIKTVDAGKNWMATNVENGVLKLPNPADKDIPDNDFTRGQHYYDLVIATDPAHDNNLYVGGIDLYKSTDGGVNWSQISKWSNNNDMRNLPVSLVHADQHAIVFNPKNSSVIFGNDGGIYYAPDKNNITASGAIAVRNARYNTTQFYTGYLNPTQNPAYEDLIAGAQDNGTQILSGAPNNNNFYNAQTFYGGDGGYCNYDDQGKYIIYSYVNNNHFVYSRAANQHQLLVEDADKGLGHFINDAVLDGNKDIFYSYRTKEDTKTILLNRIKGLSSNPLVLERSTINLGTFDSDVSYIAVSPFETAISTLFVGLEDGKLVKVSNADTTPVITNMNTPFVGAVSDIQFGRSRNEIIVTLSNYNTKNVYFSRDGGTTWEEKEGNLPDMPVRAALMNPDDANEVILGTELGIWGTKNFMSAAPSWAQYNYGLPNTRVTNLDYRPSTETLLATTYGRGVYTVANTNTLGTQESEFSHIARVYPNPSRGEVYLKYDEARFKKVNVKIFDMSGRLVFQTTGVAADERIEHGLSKGAYVLVAESGGEKVINSTIIIK